MSTPLPSVASLTTKPSTHGNMRTQLGNLRAFLAGLLGEDGETATALGVLGAFAARYMAKDAAYTVTAADAGALIDVTGTWALTLPPLSSLPAPFVVIVRNGGSGTVTPTPSDSATINGAGSWPLTPGRTAILMANGTAWLTSVSTTAEATTTFAGLLSAADKVKIDGLGPLASASSITSAAISDLATAIMTLAGTQTVSGAKTFSGALTATDNLFTLLDNADPTKQLRFEVGGLAPGTTRTLSMPTADGPIAILSGATQTFANTTTFSGQTVTVGTSILASTYGLGTGATTTGVTKAVNIGTAGLSGSITNIQIGSSVSGALGTTTFNTPTVSFGATVTAINLPDAATFLTDNLDPTKRAQFDVSAIASGTTRTYTLPNASGTWALVDVAQTFTQLQTFASGLQVTGNSAVRIGNATNNDIILRGNTVPVISVGGSTNAAVITTAGTSGGAGHVGIEIPANDNQDGFYITTDANFDGTPDTLALRIMSNGVTTTQRVRDDGWFIVDNADITKQVAFEVSAVTTGTTRTISVPNASGTLVLADAAQTLTNKSIAATQLTGTLQAAQAPALSGDVTSSAGSLATTIASGVVDNAKLAAMSTARIKGRTTAGTGAPEDLTGTQATALLDTFTSAAKGLAPASGGGTANFLRADGTWAAPASGSPGGATAQVQFNNAGAFAGASEVLVENNQLRLPSTASFTAPAAGGARLIGRADAGRSLPAFLSQDGLVREFQTSLARNSPVIWKASAGSAALSAVGGGGPTAVGTATAASIATTNLVTYTPRLEYLVTTAAINAVAGFRSTVGLVTVGGPAAGLGGFAFVGRWGPSIGVATATNRAFFGLANITSAPSDVEPSTTVNCIAMGWDAADTNIQMMFNDAAGTCTKVDLGAAFPVPTTDRSALYELSLYSPKGTSQSVAWVVTDLVTGATASGTATTDLPSTSTLLSARGWMSVGGTSSVIGLGLSSIYLDPLL